MSNLDAFFGKKGPPSYHPLLGYLVKAKPEHAEVEVVRPKDALGFKAAKIYLHLTVNGQQPPPSEYAWDDDLNAELVKRGIKAVNPENEKIRFSLGLRYGFKKAESRFGDGFFNAVLGIVVRESGFAGYPQVAEVLKHVPPRRPHMGGEGYEMCREAIAEVIADRATELVERLKYPKEQAEEILAGAMAHYLDERFTVSDRLRLGWA